MSKVRLNIYVNDPAIRKQVKTAAAKHDLSVSDYCLQAIVSRLAEEDEIPLRGKGHPLARAVKKARRFQAKAFPGRVLSVSSAALIAQARKERAKKP